MNRRTFNTIISADESELPLGQLTQNNSLVCDDLSPVYHNDDGSLGNDNPNLVGDEAEDVILSDLSHGTVGDPKLTYQFVAEKATNLVRLAQSDQIKLGSLCNLLDQLAIRLRNGQSIDVQSFGAAIPSVEDNPGAEPVLGTLRAAPNTYNQRRKISRQEFRRTIVAKKRSPMLSPVGQSNDLVHLPPPRPKIKTCSICRFPGHQRGSCPKIHQFKKPPLEMGKEIHSRHELSMALSNIVRYKNNFRSKEDVRDISISIPTKVLGVVIHRRFFVNLNTRKMCLECTILGPTGDAHPTFQNYLFSVE